MTRYCASGARSHFAPSSIPHNKCFKNLQNCIKQGSVSALRAPQGQSRLQNTHTSAMDANLYLANRNIAFYIRIHQEFIKIIKKRVHGIAHQKLIFDVQPHAPFSIRNIFILKYDMNLYELFFHLQQPYQRAWSRLKLLAIRYSNGWA